MNRFSFGPRTLHTQPRAIFFGRRARFAEEVPWIKPYIFCATLFTVVRHLLIRADPFDHYYMRSILLHDKLIFLNRSALLITETELNVIAALASIGLSNNPNTGYNTPAASGMPSTL